MVVDPAIYDADSRDVNPIGLMCGEFDDGYAQYVLAPVERLHDATAPPFFSDEQLAALPTAYGTAL